MVAASSMSTRAPALQLARHSTLYQAFLNASCKPLLYSVWRLRWTRQMGRTHTLCCTSISVLFQKPQHSVAGPRSSLDPLKTSPIPSLSCSCSAFLSFCFWTYSNRTSCWCCLHITPLSPGKAWWVQHCAILRNCGQCRQYAMAVFFFFFVFHGKKKYGNDRSWINFTFTLLITIFSDCLVLV